PNHADIIATEIIVGNTQAAGESNSTTNFLTNYYRSVTVRLNSFFLLNDQYCYDMDRIIHSA
ncbi:protease, partial [Streptococcus suis]